MELVGKIAVWIFFFAFGGFILGLIIALTIITDASNSTVAWCLAGGAIVGIVIACCTINSLIDKYEDETDNL